MAATFHGATPAAAEPQITPDQVAAYQAASEDQRTHILIKLAQAGFVNAAELMLQRFPLQGPTAQNRTLFIEGLIAERRNQLPLAAQKYRAALANDPRLTLVRAELAQVLVRLGEPDSAKHHLELLQAEVPEAQQQGIRSFIESLSANHPLTFSGYVSLAPSTNINNGSSHSTVYTPGLIGSSVDPLGTIPTSSQKQSGIGISAGGSVGYVKTLANNWQGVVAANVDATYYPMVGRLGLGFSQSAELRRLLDKGYIGLGAVASQGLDTTNATVNYASYGPRISFSEMLSPRDQLSGSASYLWRQYPASNTFAGTSLNASTTLVHALDSSSNVALLAGVGKINEQLDYNSYKDFSLGFGFYKELANGITLQGQGTAMVAGFDAVTPLINLTRQDENLTGSLTLTKRDWNLIGFAPSLNYTYVRNFSNISLYDFDSHSVDFRLTKNF